MTHPINEEAYAEWKEWRRVEKRVKVGKIAERRQRRLLEQYPEHVQAQMIDYSITNSYQGLFPPKQQSVIPARTTRDTTLEHDLTDTSWAN